MLFQKGFHPTVDILYCCWTGVYPWSSVIITGLEAVVLLTLIWFFNWTTSFFSTKFSCSSCLFLSIRICICLWNPSVTFFFLFLITSSSHVFTNPESRIFFSRNFMFHFLEGCKACKVSFSVMINSYIGIFHLNTKLLPCRITKQRKFLEKNS